VVVWLAGYGGIKGGSAGITKALNILVNETEEIVYFGNLEADASRAYKRRASVLDEF